MRTLVIVGPGLSMGGVERAVSNTLNGFVEQYPGIELVFISILKKEQFFPVSARIKIYQPDGFNLSSINLISTIYYLRSLVIKYEPSDTKILVFGKFYGAITAVSLIGLNFDYYISDRQSPIFKWDRKIMIFNRIAYFINKPVGVLAQTHVAAQYQTKYFKGSKINIIPNILREVKIYPEVNRRNVILTVGRLNDHLKGFDLLLESIALLKNQEWELHIAGGDENGKVLKEQAELLGIRHRVKFLGPVRDIDRCYAYAGIFVIPSRSEGFPNALAEAMAAGCCCVAFDFVAGAIDLINNDKNGVLVPATDIRALAIAIDGLINNSEKRLLLGKNAMEVRNELNQSAIIKRIKKLLEDE